MAALKTLWRISNHDHRTGLSGERSDGRRHTAARGKRIRYLSGHPAIALAEVLASLKGNPALFPDTYQLMKIEADERSRLSPRTSISFPTTGAGISLKRSCNAWLRDAGSALLAVPSVPSPESLNYLFNPLHKDAAGLMKVWCRYLEYDQRLFHLR